MNQALMVGVVPPNARHTGGNDDVLSDSFDDDWGSNIRTTVLCPTRQRPTNTAALYRSYREKLYDN